MSGDHILHFTIGPVQGFIEQARRTRDFWAGSFLLAWLSSIAMQTAEDDLGAKIVFPKIGSDAMIRRLRGQTQELPRIGTLPNRFKAQVAGDFDPKKVRQAVLGAWRALANSVWDAFVAEVAKRNLGFGTKQIWDRQREGFWEIAWVMGPAEDKANGGWLDWRKNWRSHRPPTEKGDHCTIMGDWQELSGWTGHNDRPRQDAFWNAMRDQQRVGDLNLVPGERLCAIALVRRLFPLLDHDELPAKLWKTPAHWPSTGHMAAARWMAEAWKQNEAACRNYSGFVAQLRPRWSQAEETGPNRRDPLPCLDGAGRFAWIDGNLFFRDNILNKYGMPLGPDEGRRDELLRRYEDLIRHIGNRPRPYYALLRMDGDHVGRLLRRDDGEAKVGEALGKFVPNVERIVKDSDGVLIYAGGDDLLALLPIDSAVETACSLNAVYRRCFGDWPTPNDPPTLSASIVFADHHEPLRAVLRASRRLLEDVAKRDNGRDSVAVAVLKPSGPAVEWVQSWHHGDRSIPGAVLHLKERIGNDDISARFSYTLERRFLATLGERFPELGLDEPELRDILRGTLGKRREENPEAERDIAALVEELLLIGTPHRGPSYRGVPQPGVHFSVDGLRLAFFLAGRDGAEQRDAA